MKSVKSIPTDELLTKISLPVVDLSDQTERHIIVAQGTEKHWQGHPSTVFMPDGRTIFCVWAGRRDGTGRHGAPAGYLKRSGDGGLTWSDYISVPGNWLEIGRGSPTIHRLVDTEGRARLFVFCRDEERTTFLQAMSEDEGASWSPMRPLPLAKPEDGPIAGWTAPMSILTANTPDGRRKHLMWYEHSREGRAAPGVIWQSASYDGGLTWGESKPVVDKAGSAEPACVRSPDGKQLLLLIREDNREMNSLFAISNDEGETWASPRLLPLALTGDRHLARYAPDGRLVVVFRSLAPGRTDGSRPGISSARNSHFMAWIGRYEDIVEGREGEFLVKLLHSHEGGNHTYPGLELLPDGTFVATTYIKYRPGPEFHSVVSVRFSVDDVCRMKSKGQMTTRITTLPVAEDFSVALRAPGKNHDEGYIYFDALERLPDGAFIALAGIDQPNAATNKGVPGHQGKIVLSRSDDGGKTWQALDTNIDFRERITSALFAHEDALYMFVFPKRADAIIQVACSLDGGLTWSEFVEVLRVPSAPLPASEVEETRHTLEDDPNRNNADKWLDNCQNAMLVRNNRLYLAVTERTQDMAIVTCDLEKGVLKPESWAMSKTTPVSPPRELSAGLFPGASMNTLEGNVVEVNGKLKVIARQVVDRYGTSNVAAVFDIIETESGSELSFVQFFPIPGAHGKFFIVYDEPSRLYWMATNLESNSQNCVTHPSGCHRGRDRRFLSLWYALDALNWFPAGIIAAAERMNQTFNYPCMIVDGNDLAVLSRTTLDAEHYTSHDADCVTFHRVPNFRSLALNIFPVP